MEPRTRNAPVLFDRRPRLPKTVLGGPSIAVRLDEQTGETKPIPEVKWIHVANEGEFAGHAQGAFEFTREVFASFVANLRRDPRFTPGDDGVGSQPVLQFDYEHASEMPPTSGTIPSNGVPAVGWVLDLQVREAEDGSGTAELWALAKLGERIRGQIAADEYRWVSIAFVLQSVDPVTGEPRGPRLTSIAFTNKPFLRDLRPLAASERGLSDYYVRPACDAEDAMRELRELFKLEVTSDAARVLAEVGKLVALAQSGAAPNGIDVDGLLGAVRVVLGLPITAAPEEILRICSAALTSPVSVEASERNREEDNMDLKKLSAALKCRHTLTEDEMVRLAEEATSAATDLTKLLEALGVANPAAALAALPELLAAKEKLGALQQELADLTAFKQKAEETQVEQDVAAAMSAHKLPGNVQVALLHLRRADPKTFSEKYPVPEADKAKLLGNVLAGPKGVQYQAPGQAPPVLTPTPRESDTGGGARDIDVRTYPGRNVTERLCAYIRATDPNAKSLSLDALVTQAGRLRRDCNVITG